VRQDARFPATSIRPWRQGYDASLRAILEESHLHCEVPPLSAHRSGTSPVPRRKPDVKSSPRSPNPRSPESMRAFYDRFQPFYGLVERSMARGLAEIVSSLDPGGDRFSADEVHEWAAGSASLGLLLAPRVARYRGFDQSEGMLGRARRRWEAASWPGKAAYPEPPLSRESILDAVQRTRAGENGPGEKGPDRDWLFISFALHLFSPADEEGILAAAIGGSRKGAIIVDHSQRPSLGIRIAEFFEGSHYEDYIRIDFSAMAERLAVSLRVSNAGGSLVMEFMKP